MIPLIMAGIGLLLLLGVWLEWRLHRQMHPKPGRRIRWSNRKFEKVWDRHALRWLAQMRNTDFHDIDTDGGL